MGLKEYTNRRNFKATPEPAKGGVRGKRIFVVQLHHASRRHFDFRLELDGVLKSWAVPKGPSLDPHVKRLAVEVEDHPLSYADFSGEIPRGNYGAGHVDIFDHGTWEPLGNARQGLRKGELKFILHGDVLRGSWVLIRTRMQGSKQQWLLIKHQDEYAGKRDADSFVDAETDRPISLAKRRKTWSRQSRAAKANAKSVAPDVSRPAKIRGGTPEALENVAFAPQLCTPEKSAPKGSEWLHEVKWDGYRLLASVVEGNVRLWSRNGIEWTDRVPELVAAVKSLKAKSILLDGEMIVPRGLGADFNALQGSLSSRTEDAIIYMLFDMPHLNGMSLRKVRLVERKNLLEGLIKDHGHPLLRYSEHQIANGPQIFAQAKTAGLEGVVSKRIDSTYAGKRNGDWVKVKTRRSDEFIVVGFTQPKGSRSGIGSLLLGSPKNGNLEYVGRVGTGMNDRQLRDLRKLLAPAVTEKTFVNFEKMQRKDRALAIWVKPQWVVEVYFQGVGANGLLRHPAFKTLRADKQPADLIVGSPARLEKSGGQSAMNPKTVRKTKSGADDNGRASVGKVIITHEQREVFPGTGISKGDVANYYRAVSPWLLPEIVGRPLAVVRCPDGAGKDCFFQKHAGAGWGKHIRAAKVKGDSSKYLYIDDETGLLELVQMNALEFHPWGTRVTDIERADRVVFDLDPHASVHWNQVVAAARDLRKQLDSVGLTCFLRTSGGKGLHVVVPLNPPARWNEVKSFAQAVAQALAELKPKQFVSVAGEKNRQGKIFVDWLRNGRGATSVASYSLRARQNAGVAMPIAWQQLSRIKSGDAYTINNAMKKISARRVDPWAEMAQIRQSLPKF